MDVRRNETIRLTLFIKTSHSAGAWAGFLTSLPFFAFPRAGRNESGTEISTFNNSFYYIQHVYGLFLFLRRYKFRSARLFHQQSSSVEQELTQTNSLQYQVTIVEKQCGKANDNQIISIQIDLGIGPCGQIACGRWF